MTFPSQSALESLWPGIRLRHVVTFTVPGSPVPKQRARVVAGQGGYYAARGRGSRRLTYPEYKELVQAECLRQCPDHGEAQEAHVTFGCCQFFLAVEVVTNRGDADNLAGSVLDALNGLVWKDDKQVTHLVARVVRGRKPGEAGLTAGIWEIEE